MIVYKLRCRFHRIYCFDLSTGSVENAKTICQTCPFQIECLLILTENDDHSATEKQKKQIIFVGKQISFVLRNTYFRQRSEADAVLPCVS